MDVTRRDFLKKAGLTVAGGVAGSMLAACQPKVVEVEKIVKETVEVEKVVEVEAKVAPKEAVTIRFHARIGEQENKLYEMQMPQFMEDYPHLTVELENFPGTEYLTKISTMQAGGTIGDVIWAALGGTTIQAFTSQGITAPLDDIVASTDFDLTQYYEGCLKGITVFDKLMGLPFKAHPGFAITYYNKTLIEQAGLQEPTADWTMDDQDTMVKAIRETANGQPVFGIMPSTHWKRFVTMCRAFGGEIISEDGKKCQLTSEAGEASAKRIYDMFQTYGVAPTPDQVIGGTNQMWTTGLVGMFEAGTWASVLRNTIGDKFEWMAVNNPLGPAGVGGSDYEVDCYSMTKATEHPEEAFEWLKYLCSRESGVLLGVIGGTVGGRPDVYGSPTLLRDPVRPVFAEIMENAQDSIIPENWRLTELQNAIAQLMQPLWVGEEEPTQGFLSSVEEQLQAIMDKPRP